MRFRQIYASRDEIVFVLLDVLNDLDDVQKVFTNADFEESALNEYAESIS